MVYVVDDYVSLWLLRLLFVVYVLILLGLVDCLILCCCTFWFVWLLGTSFVRFCCVLGTLGLRVYYYIL